MKKVRFDVQGMTCSSCQAHVEKAVSKLDGVKQVNVNLISNNMIVDFDETAVNNENIIEAVVKAGYGASVHEEAKQYKSNTLKQEDLIKSMKKRLVVSICFLIPLMYIAMYPMLESHLGFQHIGGNAVTIAFTQFLLLLPILYLNRNYFIIGFKMLFSGKPNMDSLIAIGAGASIIYGIFSIYMRAYGINSYYIYFESAGMILTLVTVGKYLETKSKGKTSDAINKLINLAPKTAMVIRDNKETEISVENIVQGDTILIKPGGSIPVDGIIIEGNSWIDQSMITGEGIPVEKHKDDEVISGTINKNGSIKIKATRVGENTTLSHIIKLVEEASNSKAPISKIADKVSSIFVPTVIAISLVTFIIWLVIGKSFEFAMTMAIAVLVISCPCALGLATPVAIMVGTGKAAENGILIKSAESLESLHLIDTVVLDKTGTVTEGKPTVTDIVTDMDEKEFLKVAGSLEKNSEHPLAEAIVKKAKEENIDLIDVESFLAIPGRGVEAKIDDKTYYAGNKRFMQENNINIEEIRMGYYQTPLFTDAGLIYIAEENHIIGAIAISDTIKVTSGPAIQALKQKGIKTVMITGDSQKVAEKVANELKIEKVIAEVLPQDKEKEVENLQKKGHKIAFIGDGINDSPALAKADVGIAIGSGTDIAIESADVILMKNNLQDVVTAIDLSKATIRNIKQNLFWAFFYNSIGIPIACGLFYPMFGLKLNPMIGAAAMSLSSVFVVTNALRLKYFKPNKKAKEEVKLNTRIIHVEGMMCEHCKSHVEEALSQIDGITKVEVSLENKTACIETSKEVPEKTIKNAVEEAGYKVI